MTRFDDLIEEGSQLERRASEIQGARLINLDDGAIVQIALDYHAWFARAMDALPDEYHERFRDEFEGGVFIKKIKTFLAEPAAENPLYDGEKPQSFISYWAHPFEVSFRPPFLSQLQILGEAKQQAESAMAPRGPDPAPSQHSRRLFW